MFHLFSFIIIVLSVLHVKGQSVIKFSSSCAVPTCGISGNGSGGSCAGATPCFRFQSTNETLCAPQAHCTLFDLCISGTRCSTNTSICVVNSCCSQPICMPRVLASTCVASNSNASTYTSSYVTTTPSTFNVAIDTAVIPRRPLSASIRLCNNATWDPNFSIISGVNGTPGTNETMFQSPTALFIDDNNLIYVSDSGNYRIQRFNINSTIGTTVAQTFPFQSMGIYIDGTGTIYSCEQASGIMQYGRVQKYAGGNVNGVTLLGGVGKCGTELNQLCGCAGIYADRQGSLYISDYANGRILQYNSTTGSVALFAGVNGIPGYRPQQLQSPRSIYVDENQTLFVSQGWNPEMKAFVPGNSTGSIVFSNYMFHSYYDGFHITGDSLSSLYLVGPYIGRWTSIEKNVSNIIDPSLLGLNVYNGRQVFIGVGFDTSGSLYTVGSYMLLKFNLLSNIC